MSEQELYLFGKMWMFVFGQKHTLTFSLGEEGQDIYVGLTFAIQFSTFEWPLRECNGQR